MQWRRALGTRGSTFVSSEPNAVPRAGDARAVTTGGSDTSAACVRRPEPLRAQSGGLCNEADGGTGLQVQGREASLLSVESPTPP